MHNFKYKLFSYSFMKKIKLSNGLTLLLEKKDADSVSVFVSVKTGCIHEDKKNNGISHFIEHMIFEGTKKRKSSNIISNGIEKIGGVMNAYTSDEKTCFYVKVPKKHMLIALDLLSDMIQNSVFNEKTIEKERKVILKEINLHKDEPRFHQWVLFQETLFQNINAKLPTYGSIKAVKSLKKKDLFNYYKKYYVPSNMVVSVVGGFNDFGAVKKYFDKFCGEEIKQKELIEKPLDKNIVKKETKKLLNSYMVLGYKTVNRLHKDGYVLDVIRAILCRGQSGRIYYEIRNKRGLAYEVGVHNELGFDLGFFAIYLNTDKSKIKIAVNIILKELKLKNLTQKEIKEAKGNLAGQYILDNEDTHDLAEELAFWEVVKDVNLQKTYLKEISKVTKKDILRVAKKYFTNYALAVIEQS